MAARLRRKHFIFIFLWQLWHHSLQAVNGLNFFYHLVSIFIHQQAKLMIKKIASHLIYLSFFMLSAQFCSAQTGLRLGVKGGISIPNLQSSGDNPVSAGWSTSKGPYAGIVAELQLSDRFYLQGELNYSSQGGKKDGAQAIPTAGYEAFFPVGFPVPPYLYADFYSEGKFGYLELPILLKANFRLGETTSFFVNGGPYFGYLLKAQSITKGSSNVYYDAGLTQPFLTAPISFDAEMDIKDELKKFNFGIQAGIGLSLDLANENRLMFTVGGNYGLIPIQKDEVNGQNNIGAATATVAYLIKF